MPTSRALLLLICPLLLLGLAGPLLAAQRPGAPDPETARQAADQETLRATVAEQGRDLDRLSGKVAGLQTSLDAAAKASEASGRSADHAIRTVETCSKLVAYLITFIALVLTALGLREISGLRQHRKDAEKAAKATRECEVRVRAIAERCDELLKHIQQRWDAVQSDAHQLQQTISDISDVSEEQKQALREWASRFDLLEPFGLPLDPEAYLARGNDYYTKREYERAAQCYEKATQLRPEYDAAWANWGSALGAQAETKDGTEADALFEQTYEKYARAVEIKPEDYNTWNNWGVAFSDQAKTKQGAEADSLFQPAYEKYARAVEIKPDEHQAWNNWGNALSSRAETKEGAEADALFQQAYEKYARAVEIKPEDHEAWYNWGTALGAQARTKQDDEADALFRQAGEKYARSVKIKPDYHMAWDNWGYSLASQAAKKHPDEAAPLLEQAFQKLQRALDAKPDHANAMYNRGYAHLVAGDRDQAIADLKRAIDLDPKYREMAKTDPDFKPLHSNPDFRKLVGLDPEQPEENQP